MPYMRFMPAAKQFPHKQLLQLDAEMKERIDDFRYRERFASEAAAIRELITRGLAAKPKAKR